MHTKVEGREYISRVESKVQSLKISFNIHIMLIQMVTLSGLVISYFKAVASVPN